MTTELTYNNIKSIEYTQKLGIDIKAYNLVCKACDEVVLEFPNGYRVKVVSNNSEKDVNQDIKIVDKSQKSKDVVY